MKAWSHFKTITKHRNKVMCLCFKAGIPFRGMLHDLSKYTLSEFVPGCRYYLGTRSPNEAQRVSEGYSSAWLHHKGRNKHHFEYWRDVNMETGMEEPVKMPTRFLKEMFCDRVAASMIYQGKNYTDEHPLQYFLKGKGKRIIHPETSDILESWLCMLKDKGQTETFKYIRGVK